MIRRRLSPDEIAAAAGTLDAVKTLTDAVGTVRSLDEGTVVLRTRRGDVHVARADIVTAKALGPRPGRRGAPHRAVSVEDLEGLMVEGWPPHEREWLGRWMLRAADRYTGRANSALVLGEPGMSTDDALTAVRRWYDARSLPPMLQVPLAPGFSAEDDPLVRDAAILGWEAITPVRVMTAASAEVAMTGGSGHAAQHDGDGVASARLTVTDEPSDAWWGLVDERARSHEDAARRIMTGSIGQRFLMLSDGAGPLAHARLALSPGWAGLFVLATRPDVRRRGLARRLVQACGEEALRAQAPSMYLQVAADNSAAIALYESLGFTTHHTYVYLRRA